MCKWQVSDPNNDSSPPEYSLANGLDFGVLSRVPLLAGCELTPLETIVLSHVRLYHVTIKVRLSGLSWCCYRSVTQRWHAVGR